MRSDKEKILQYAAECESANLMKNRKTMKPAKFDELDRVLYEWFKQRRSEGIPISGFILREKAREFHQTMDLEELLLYYIIIFGEKFDYPVNSIIRTGAGPVESGLPSFYCIYILYVSDFLFVPLRPFFYAALVKRWKVQFRKGLRKFNNVDSKTTYFNENCCIM